MGKISACLFHDLPEKLITRFEIRLFDFIPVTFFLYLSVTTSMINAMIKSCAKKEINLKFLEVSQESKVNILEKKR